MTCLALLPVFAGSPQGAEVPVASVTCVHVAAELAGRASQAFPQTGLHRTLDLSRARADLAVDHAGRATARVSVVAARSAGEGDYIGVEGESIVPIVQVAEARLALPRAGLVGAMGLVDDVWALSGQDAWGLRALARAFPEDSGLFYRSDVGGTLAWSAPRSLVTVAAQVTSGEGLAYRERNNGQDVTGVVLFRPVPERVEVGLVARDGSVGLQLARDRRVGGRVTGGVTAVQGGLELVKAWGVDGDPQRTPVGGSAWVTATPSLPVVGWLRADWLQDDLASAATRSLVPRAGIGWSPALPAGAEGHIALGYEGLLAGDQAVTVAGAQALTTSHTVFLQLGAGATGSHPLGSTP